MDYRPYLIMRAKTIKILEENLRETSLWPWVKQRFFLDIKPKAQTIKEKNWSLRFHQS